MDENLIHKVNSKYYDIIDFTMVNKNPKSLSMFHINLRSLSAHVEELQLLLKSLNANFDVFPDKLKVAKVYITLHKKGATDNPSNYRLISLLSTFSKIFEKIMHKRLYDFLEVNKILHSLQFGFRQKHSISHTLISMTEKIRNSIDNGNYGCGIFIDLKKAFDTVNHSIL